MKKIILLSLLLIPILSYSQDEIHQHKIIDLIDNNRSSCIIPIYNKEIIINLRVKAANLSPDSLGVYILPPELNNNLFVRVGYFDDGNNFIVTGTSSEISNFISSPTPGVFYSDTLSFDISNAMREINRVSKILCKDGRESFNYHIFAELVNYDSTTNEYILADLSSYSNLGGAFDRTKIGEDFIPTNPSSFIELKICCGEFGILYNNIPNPRIQSGPDINYVFDSEFSNLNVNDTEYLIIRRDGQITHRTKNYSESIRQFLHSKNNLFLITIENGKVIKKEIISY